MSSEIAVVHTMELNMKNLIRLTTLMLKTPGLLLVLFLVCGGCAQKFPSDVEQHESQSFYGQPGISGELFSQQSVPNNVFAARQYCVDKNQFAAPLNYRVDKPIISQSHTQQPISIAREPSGLPLSPGDMIEVFIENGEGFNGRYVLDNNGVLMMPIILPISAAGLSTAMLAQEIELALIKAKIFRPATASVSAKIIHLASIDVPVTGAVFQPGRVTINGKNTYSENDKRLVAIGDFSNKRLLSEALRAASGIRPDAKLDQVILVRNGWHIEVDLTGIISGQQVTDYALIAGDQIIVPSTGCFQPYLVRPSQITPKGFRVFMSNLIDSALSNSSAAVGRYSTNLPYGTRLLQAAVSANCVGGKEWTNAPRKVVLASVNPITQQTQVIERSVEQLMRGSNREAINPYLMPNDAVACYDSDVTNLRDVARTVLDIINPLALIF